jgi:hypothetical protein
MVDFSSECVKDNIFTVGLANCPECDRLKQACGKAGIFCKTVTLTVEGFGNLDLHFLKPGDY